MSSTTSFAVISLRIPPAQRELIDRAARLQGKSRTDLMLEASREKAENPAALDGIAEPSPLIAAHDTSQFVCRHDSLSAWLSKRALANAASGASRTYVVCTSDRQVIGYYAFSSGSIAAASVTARLRRNMPYPLPVIVLGRLAVHTDWAGQGIGGDLLKDAVLRATQASALIRVRALLCHAIDEKAMGFYVKHGFVSSPRAEFSRPSP